MSPCLFAEYISDLIFILKCGCKLKSEWFGLDKNTHNYSCSLYGSFYWVSYVYYLKWKSKQILFCSKKSLFPKDWLTRKTINHLTQDFGKKEI